MGLNRVNKQQDVDQVLREFSTRETGLDDRIAALEADEGTIVSVMEAIAYASATTTAAAQTVISKTIDGGSLGANGNFRAYFFQIYSNSTGSAQLITYEVFFGGGAIWTDTISVPTGGNKTVCYFEVTMGNRNNAASQNWSVVARLTNTVAIDSLSNLGIDQMGYDVTAVDTASDQTFQIKITMPVADANLSWELFGGRFITPLAA